MPLTGSVSKTLEFVIVQIPGTKNGIYTVIDQIGDDIFGYILAIGFVKYLSKVANQFKLNATARLVYTDAYLLITLYFKGIDNIFDLLKISKLEEIWFGQPIYTFDYNRLWIETNFIL